MNKSMCASAYILKHVADQQFWLNFGSILAFSDGPFATLQKWNWIKKAPIYQNWLVALIMQGPDNGWPKFLAFQELVWTSTDMFMSSWSGHHFNTSPSALRNKVFQFWPHNEISQHCKAAASLRFLVWISGRSILKSFSLICFQPVKVDRSSLHALEGKRRELGHSLVVTKQEAIPDL